MYKTTVITNSYLSKWNANHVFVPKPGQVQSYFIFNYYFIFKDIVAIHTKKAMIVYTLLSYMSYQ